MQRYHVEEFTKLPFTEQFALWGFRLWSVGRRNEFNVREKLEQGFARGGAPLAAGTLCQLMETITPFLHRPLYVNFACYDVVTEDEDFFLNAIAQCQAGNGGTVKFWVADLVPAHLVPITQSLLEQFAEALVQGGIYMCQARILYNNEICQLSRAPTLRSLH